jgi:Putative beta-barrel porin 2
MSQQVVTFPVLGNPSLQNVPPATGGPTQPGSATDETIPIAVSPEYRRLHYELKLDLRGVYDDNIGLSSVNPISDYYFRIDPAIKVGFGDTTSADANFLRFEYDPDIVLFLDHSNLNTFQNVIHFDGRVAFSRLTLSVSELAQLLNGSDVNQATSSGTFVNAVNLDVRGQPRVNMFDTQLSAAYQLASKTSLSLGMESSIADYSGFVSSHAIWGNVFVNYTYSPKLTIGLGGVGGREFVDQPTPDQTFEQGNVRIAYEITGKLLANVSAGVEFRQFDSGRSDYISPVFAGTLSYTPFDGTEFSLIGSRSTTSSASLVGQDFTSTQLVASVRQRLLDRFFVSLTGGYQNLHYIGAVGGIGATRDDDYYFIQPAVDVRITRFWYAGGYYLHRQNNSSASFFGFVENQSGLRMTLTF